LVEADLLHLTLPSSLYSAYIYWLICINKIIKTTATVNTHGPYSFVGTSGNNVAEVVLTYNTNNDVSQLLMQVKTTNSPPAQI